MKKKLQKYLSGEREGFSLIELIIVIAIMAILIGVVALVVIPYLEDGRESTDRAALGEVQTAFKTAMTDETMAKKFKNMPRTASGSLDADLKAKIEKYLEKSLADTESGLASENCVGKHFYFTVSTSGYTVDIGDSSGAAVDGDGKAFKN